MSFEFDSYVTLEKNLFYFFSPLDAYLFEKLSLLLPLFDCKRQTFEIFCIKIIPFSLPLNHY